MTSLPPRFASLSRSARLLCAGLGLLGLPAAHATFSLSTIHTFDPATDGNVTYPALVLGADGKLYGVNSTGGRSDNGTIFSLSLGGGNFDVLNTFTQPGQGTNPEGGLVQARDGNFYGTTYNGGANGDGTLYQVVPSTGKLNILSAFTNGDPGGNPVGTLVEGIDGLLYGTAQFGGIDNFGTVFRAVPPTGGATTFAEITGGLAGDGPQSDLIQAYDGNFYGTTETGGTDNLGTFFQVTPAGVYTVLYSFTGQTDGSRPLRGVVQGTDGAFYGVSNQGGTYGGGAIFRFTVAGGTATFTSLYNFVPIVDDGSNALGNLVQASDGNFYGTTAGGGENEDGTIFRITPSGAYTLLYSFTGGADGMAPVAGLVQGTDGKLYGTTAGMNASDGTIFSIDAGLTPPAPAPNLFLVTSATAGETLLIKGNHFVGTTAVGFVGANGSVVATFTVLSNTVLQVVVPDGALTGVVSVTANGITASTPTELIIAAAAPAPVALSTVSVLATAATASKADGAKGKFKISRTGDTSAALTVTYQIAPASSAVLGTDYELVAGGAALNKAGTVTIPAGSGGVSLKVVPVQSSTPGTATTVFLKVKSNAGYLLGSPSRAVVQVLANGTGQ